MYLVGLCIYCKNVTRTFQCQVNEENHKILEDARMAGIGKILTVQRGFLWEGWLRKAVRTHTVRSLTEDIDKEHGSDVLQQINFSELRNEITFWAIALKKATEISWEQRTFYKPCLFTHTTNFHVDLHRSVLSTFGCDTLIPAVVVNKCFHTVDPPTAYLRILTAIVLFTRPAMARKRQILLHCI